MTAVLACPSVDWELVEVEDRGEVLQVSHGADFAGLFLQDVLGRRHDRLRRGWVAIRYSRARCRH